MDVKQAIADLVESQMMGIAWGSFDKPYTGELVIEAEVADIRVDSDGNQVEHRPRPATLTIDAVNIELEVAASQERMHYVVKIKAREV